MTERTIRALAKELAGCFYTQAASDLFGSAPEDRERSARFRATYPSWTHYKKGWQVLPDGRIKQDVPGWLYHVDLAKKRLVQMLGEEKTSDTMKKAIYDALIEEHNKATMPQALRILQRRNKYNDKPVA